MLCTGNGDLASAIRGAQWLDRGYNLMLRAATSLCTLDFLIIVVIKWLLGLSATVTLPSWIHQLDLNASWLHLGIRPDLQLIIPAPILFILRLFLIEHSARVVWPVLQVHHLLFKAHLSSSCRHHLLTVDCFMATNRLSWITRCLLFVRNNVLAHVVRCRQRLPKCWLLHLLQVAQGPRLHEVLGCLFQAARWYCLLFLRSVVQVIRRANKCSSCVSPRRREPLLGPTTERPLISC